MYTSNSGELNSLRDENVKLKETIKALDALIAEIEAVACGEEQIQADGVYDDSDGLKWIYDRIQSARATIAKTALALAKKKH